jgi:hypothetical protein
MELVMYKRYVFGGGGGQIKGSELNGSMYL